MELLQVFRILYQKKWIILGSTLIAFLLAFLLTLKTKRVFTSIAQLSTGFTVTENIKLADENFNLPQIDVKFNNAIENITSNNVMSLLSYDLLLHDLNMPNQAYRQPDPKLYKQIPELKDLKPADVKRILNNKKDSLTLLSSAVPIEKYILNLIWTYGYDLESLNKNLTVERNKRTDYIDITFQSENPNLSAYVVNDVCSEFQYYYEAFSKARSNESMVSLDTLVKRKKLEMDAKISERARFLTDSLGSNSDPNAKGQSVAWQISQYESALADEQAKSQSLSYQVGQLNNQLKTGSGSAISTPTVSDNDNTQYILLRRQYNDLLDEYTRDGSKDPEMKKRLDDLKDKMKAAAPSTVTSRPGSDAVSSNDRSNMTQLRIDAEGQLRAANAKIAFYSGKLNQLHAELNKTSPGASATLQRLDKEVELVTNEYTSAKEKLNQASNSSNSTVNNFKQSLFGQPAIAPENSKRKIIIILASLSAFILSSLFFIFLNYIDQSIQTPSQFFKHTGLKLLGSINLINFKSKDLKEYVTHFEQEKANRKNSFRELLRKVRFQIENSGKHIFLFTSTEPQQGKTTLSQALAFSLSLSKKKVLLIDTNFCNNDLTVANKALETLENFHLSKHSSELNSLITKTEVENVDIIGCKGGDYTPSEIISKDHLLNNLHQFLDRYDYIFLEGAPMNGYTDTKELVNYVDGVIAVFSATIVIKQTDQDSIKYLKSLNGKMVGAILNKVEDAKMNQ